MQSTHPSKWVLVEVFSSHTVGDQRILDALEVVDVFDDSEPALREYLRLHKQDHRREMYVLHTDRDDLHITELKWAGIRAA